MKINIELTELNQEEAKGGNISAAAFMPYEQATEAHHLARDILAPLVVAQVMREKGNNWQRSHAAKLGEMFVNCSAVCGSALWFLGSQEEAEALTIAEGYRVRAFGQMSPRGCFVLILQNDEENEKAILCRANW